jgi:hypothetical protein|nr:SIR2 family protein [Kofleriaceae bacterium]
MSTIETTPTAIVFGAGASCAEGAPLQGSLFRDYFTLQQAQASNVHHDWDRELATFFSDFFGINVDHGNLTATRFPTFEEVLGVVEIAESQGESFRDWGTSHLVTGAHKPRLQHVRDLLILLIAQVLDKKLGDGPAIHHNKLLAKLGPAIRHTTFISFNYDLLLDNALVDLHRTWDLDYAINFSNYSEDDGWHRPRADRSALLLKLHGSLNWLYCTTCRSVTLTPKEKGVCRLKWEPETCICSACETLAVPIVIPPTYLKALSNLHLRQIWDAAERALLSIDRIIFCGYSFPDADIHVRYLLKRTELNRKRATPLEVFVVNEHAGKTDAARDSERDRYERFFVDKQRVHWTSLSFEEFAANPSLVGDRTCWR